VRTPADFGRVPSTDSGIRPALPANAWQQVRDAGVRFDGCRALDVGSGNGPEARALRDLGAHVVSSDIALPLLQQEAGFGGPRLPRAQASATALPFADSSFDLVTAAQCWWWFDRASAASEIRRVLRPDGHVAILSHDWVPLAGNVVEATEALVLEHNPDWDMAGGDGLHPEWRPDLLSSAFEIRAEFHSDVMEPFSHVGWRARIRASAGVGASLAPAGIQAFDDALADLLTERFPEEPLQVAHRSSGIVARVI
jgi:SAM-dependent methyltransferase